MVTVNTLAHEREVRGERERENIEKQIWIRESTERNKNEIREILWGGLNEKSEREVRGER